MNKKSRYIKDNGELNIEKLVCEYKNYIMTILRKSSQNLSEEDLEEICSDVFITIWCNRSKLDLEKNFSPYIASITHNLLKKKYRNVKIFEDIEEYPNLTYEITIEGSTGQFLEIRNCKEFKQDENKAYTLEEAKEIADKYFKQFGFDKDGFEFTKVQVDVGPDVKKDGEQTRGSRLEVLYNKKYNNQISNSQYVDIVLDTGLEDSFETIRTKNEPFENNEYIITKDEAINKAKEYDKNITDMKIAETKAEKKIVEMNDKAYSRMQNYEEFYEPMQNENFDNSKYNYYAVDEKLRNA